MIMAVYLSPVGTAAKTPGVRWTKASAIAEAEKFPTSTLVV